MQRNVRRKMQWKEVLHGQAQERRKHWLAVLGRHLSQAGESICIIYL